MPTMSPVESSMCRSATWGRFAQRVILPWALQGTTVRGDVLEIGGGSGAMAAALLRRFPGIRLTVTDYDDEMVATAKARLPSSVTVEQADATRLPYADGTFDTVLSFIMLHHVVAWEDAVREAVRVVRPGGWVVGYDLTRTQGNRLFHKLDRSPHRLLRRRELEALLDTLPVDRAVLTPSLGGHALRFRLRRS